MDSAGLTENQRSFAKFLVRLWSPSETASILGEAPAIAGVHAKGVLHGYRISKSRHWKQWRSLHPAPVAHWWCDSLSQAGAHSSWPEAPPPNSFQCIAARLRQALAEADQRATRDACLEVFRWGGVARKPDDKSRIWLDATYAQGALCQSIVRAI